MFSEIDNINNRIHYIYDVYEKPQGPGFLGLENQVLESQVLENPGQINTNIRNTKKEKVLISKDISTRENFLGSSSKKQSNNSLYSKCIAMLDDFVVTHNLDNEVRKQLIEYLNFRLLNSVDMRLYSLLTSSRLAAVCDPTLLSFSISADNSFCFAIYSALRVVISSQDL